MAVGAPSPFFAFFMLHALENPPPGGTTSVVGAGLGCAVVWGLVGLALLFLAWRKSRKTIAAHDAAVAQADAALAAEDSAS